MGKTAGFKRRARTFDTTVLTPHMCAWRDISALAFKSGIVFEVSSWSKDSRSPVYGVACTKIATTILLQVTYERSWDRMYNTSLGRRNVWRALDFNGAGVCLSFSQTYITCRKLHPVCSTATVLKAPWNLLFSRLNSNIRPERNLGRSFGVPRLMSAIFNNYKMIYR